jgi:lactate 2-monooxygenase
MLWELGSLRAILKVIWRAGTVRRARAWIAVMNSGEYRTWADLTIIRKNWNGPLLIKGIQTVADAHTALDAGADGIIVSNHGGRQVDNAIASLDALADICSDERLRESGVPILFDSGVRTGTDVLVALALGARAVLLGRPIMWGLALGGQAGVEHVLRCTLAEMDNTLGLIGKTNVHKFDRDNDLVVL